MAETEGGSKSPTEPGEHKAGIGSKLVDLFTEHKALVIGMAVGVGFVLFIVSKSQSSANSANTANTGAANQQGDLGASGAQNAQTATALQDLQAQFNNLQSTIGNIAQGPAGPTGPAGAPGPTGPAGGSGNLPGLGWTAPLIPYSQTWSGKHYFPVAPNHQFTWNGVKYWITGNTGGVITGVPGATSAQQASGKGTVVLYAPASAYVKPVLNPLANHSPIYNFMPLGQTSGHMDLGQPSVAGNHMAISPVARNGKTWSGGQS